MPLSSFEIAKTLKAEFKLEIVDGQTLVRLTHAKLGFYKYELKRNESPRFVFPRVTEEELRERIIVAKAEAWNVDMELVDFLERALAALETDIREFKTTMKL